MASPASSKQAVTRTRDMPDVTLDPAKLDHEIALLVEQWLSTRSYPRTAEALNEEVLSTSSAAQADVVREVERGLLDGEYGILEGLVGASGLRPQTQRAFLYMCYRQQFLEHVENRESQKAFNLLSKRLKPLEHYQPYPYDFYNLAYLTSASTVHDAPAFRDWKGVQREREGLVGMWRELMQAPPAAGAQAYVPPNRLEVLLRQAAQWQVQQAPSSRSSAPVRAGPVALPSLLRDYQPLVLPNALRLLVRGHQANVKCVDVVSANLGVSGSSDSTLRIFALDDGRLVHRLTGHTSRVWDSAASPSGALVVSASGDGSIRVWDVADGSSRALLQGDGGDVYSVRWRPGHDQVTSASYDKILRSWDVETQRQIRTFSGHSMSTHTVAYDPSGNTIASGAKDKHIRFWDAVGGVCTHSITDCLGEITSLEFDDQGLYLLAGCRDNSNRLYDLRMRRNLFRYTGHQNTSKSFVRATFGLDSSLVISGSEDGMVYIWDREASSSTATAAETTASRPGADDRSASSVVSSPPIMSVTGPARGYHPPTINGRPGTLPPPSSKGVTTVRPSKVLEGHVGGTVYDVAWIAGGGLLSGGEDGTVAIWDAVES